MSHKHRNYESLCGHTLHSTKASIMPCTTLISRNRPFSTVIDRSFLPEIVLHRLIGAAAGGFPERLLVVKLLTPPSSSIEAEVRRSRLDSACTLIASCLRSL